MHYWSGSSGAGTKRNERVSPLGLRNGFQGSKATDPRQKVQTMTRPRCGRNKLRFHLSERDTMTGCDRDGKYGHCATIENFQCLVTFVFYVRLRHDGQKKIKQDPIIEKTLSLNKYHPFLQMLKLFSKKSCTYQNTIFHS